MKPLQSFFQSDFAFCIIGGKAGASPSRSVLSFPSATAVRLHGHTILVDCGEGTQFRLFQAGISRSSISHIFITHLHGDHIFGLPGLLASMSSDKRHLPLTIVGPPDTEQAISSILRFSDSSCSFPITYVVTPDVLSAEWFRTEHWTASSAPVEHRITAFAYRFNVVLPRKINLQKLQQHGIEPGPQVGLLRSTGKLMLPHGKIILLEDVSDPPIHRSITFSGDTRPTNVLTELAKNSTVLVHEATFADSETEKAHSYHHSTASDAAHTARQAKVQRLVLTHISSRYDSPLPLLRQAQHIFANTSLAKEMEPELIA